MKTGRSWKGGIDKEYELSVVNGETEQSLFLLLALCAPLSSEIRIHPGIEKASLTGGSYYLLQGKVRKSSLHMPFLKFLLFAKRKMPRCLILG